MRTEQEFRELLLAADAMVRDQFVDPYDIQSAPLFTGTEAKLVALLAKHGMGKKQVRA